MKVVKTDDNRPMTLREIEICQQFEQSDRSGQALWWPLVAPGDPAPGDPASECLVLLEGNGRYAITFLHDQWSVRDGEWCHHAKDGAVTPMGNVREKVWEAAMSIKDRLSQDRDFGCYVIPVIVLTDMTPDPGHPGGDAGQQGKAAVGSGRPGGPAGRPARRRPGAEATGQAVDVRGGGEAEPAARCRQPGPTAEGGDPDGERRSGDDPGRR